MNERYSFMTLKSNIPCEVCGSDIFEANVIYGSRDCVLICEDCGNERKINNFFPYVIRRWNNEPTKAFRNIQAASESNLAVIVGGYHD